MFGIYQRKNVFWYNKKEGDIDMSEDNGFNSENVVGNGSSVDNEKINYNENFVSSENLEMPNDAADSFNNVTGSVNDFRKPKRNLKAVIAVVAMFAVVAMAAGIFFFSKSALGKNSHILTALRNTFASGESEDISKLDKLMEAGKYALDMQLSYDGSEVAVACDIDRPAKQMSVNGSFSEGNTSVGVVGTIDDTYFKFAVPGYINGTFEYNYTAENTGYFVDIITQATGMDIAEFNKLFSNCFTMPESRAEVGNDEYTKMLFDDFNELDFEKVEEKEFSVAGETKDCKGYKAVITKEILEKWIDNYKELDMVNAVTANNLDIIKQSLTDFGQFAVTVYIADKKAAAIEIEFEGDVLSIKFEGKENPLYNIVITGIEDGENEEIRIDTTKDSNDTKIVVTFMGEEFMSASYNSETGKVSVTCVDDVFTLDGMYKYDETGLELVIDNMTIDGDSFSGMFKISDEVSIESIDSSLPVIDAGNATEQEFQSFLMSNMDLQGLYNLSGMGSDDELYDDSFDDYDMEDLEGYDMEDLYGYDLDDYDLDGYDLDGYDTEGLDI